MQGAWMSKFTPVGNSKAASLGTHGRGSNRWPVSAVRKLDFIHPLSSVVHRGLLWGPLASCMVAGAWCQAKSSRCLQQSPGWHAQGLWGLRGGGWDHVCCTSVPLCLFFFHTGHPFTPDGCGSWGPKSGKQNSKIWNSSSSMSSQKLSFSWTHRVNAML